MRANLEDLQARRVRHLSPKYGVILHTLTGTFLVPDDGPSFLFFDPGAADRTVMLPVISPFAGQQYLISNSSSTRVLNITDADGVAVGTLGSLETGLFSSSMSVWRMISSSALGTAYLSMLLREPRLVTTGSDSVGATDMALAVSRAAPSTTAISLPAVASRNKVPARIIDWSTAVTDHTITLTPNGAETIMGQATWPLFSNSASLASITLYPSTVLSGWYVAP